MTLKKELVQEIKRRRIRKKYTDHLIRGQSEFTKLKHSKMMGEVYFFTTLNGGAFGKANTPFDAFHPPTIQFINPNYVIDCSMQWSPALTLKTYIESIMVCEDLSIPQMDLDDESTSKFLQIFPDEKLLC